MKEIINTISGIASIRFIRPTVGHILVVFNFTYVLLVLPIVAVLIKTTVGQILIEGFYLAGFANMPGLAWAIWFIIGLIAAWSNIPFMKQILALQPYNGAAYLVVIVSGVVVIVFGCIVVVVGECGVVVVGFVEVVAVVIVSGAPGAAVKRQDEQDGQDQANCKSQIANTESLGFHGFLLIGFLTLLRASGLRSPACSLKSHLPVNFTPPYRRRAMSNLY
jgi:hypothetical protein